MGGHFIELKKHLNRKRDKVVIYAETDDMICFDVKNKYFEKAFYIWYFDDDSPDLSQTKSLRDERPIYKHYWMTFNQENYPQRGQFVCICDMSWYANEDELITQIKRFCRNWRK